MIPDLSERERRDVPLAPGAIVLRVMGGHRIDATFRKAA